MKCLINCPYKNTEWVNKYIPEMHPYLLKLVNKPLIEYYIDFCILNKIKDIRIISDKGLRHIEEHLGDGSKWGVAISYSISRPEDRLKTTLLKNKNFVSDEEILTINGLFFIDYNIEEPFKLITGSAVKKIAEINVERLIYFNGKDQVYQDIIHESGLHLFPLSSITDYFDISMSVINSISSHFILPGYNNDRDIFIGSNVSISKSCIIKKNVMIGNNVSLNSEVTLDRGSIIGDNVIIDKSTQLRNSIIFDNTYLGSDLLFEHKILSQNLIIDPINGEKFTLTDNFFASPVKTKKNNENILKSYHKLAAVILIALMFIPFILVRSLTFLISSLKKIRKKYITTLDRNMCILSIYESVYPNLLNSMFYKFSLDKFFLLFEVLKGNLYLCGNSILEDESYNIRLLKEYQNYHPAVFTYKEYLNTEDVMTGILNDLYYSNNISIWQDTKILIKSLVANIFVK